MAVLARIPFVLALAAALLALPSGAGAEGAEVRGRVRLAVEGVRLADLGPTLVYLEPLGRGRDFAVPSAVPRIRQKDATFAPPFLAVAAGQTVALPNDDTIYHNVFSYSKPNDFDLGLYPRGETKYVKLAHPGVVRIYCSIHESMSAVIFVAPTPHFARVDAAGAFAIAGVPAGRYRIVAWNDRLPEAGREITLDGRDAFVELAVGESAPGSGGGPGTAP